MLISCDSRRVSCWRRGRGEQAGYSGLEGSAEERFFRENIWNIIIVSKIATIWRFQDERDGYIKCMRER
jgi:hypothetical protein